MLEKPILIFSNYCKFSNHFLETLKQYPDLYNSIVMLNIDVDPNTKRRPEVFYQIQQALDTKITKVPTIITPDSQILIDTNAFKWLEYNIIKLQELLQQQKEETKKEVEDDTELEGFNANEMTSFSDNYASLDTNPNVQSYKHYEDGKLNDDNYLQTNKAWDPNNKTTNGFLDELETNTNTNSNTFTNRQSINLQPQRQNINFADPNFGLAGKLNVNQKHSKGTGKSKELDSKLEDLLHAREETDAMLNTRRKI